MSTRAGKFVSSDDLIEETRRRALEEVTVRRPELPEEERRAIARSVALAAIRYDIVRVSPEKATVFDWGTALDFERQSGPYVQYAHARACWILAKAGDWSEAYASTRPTSWPWPARSRSSPWSCRRRSRSSGPTSSRRTRASSRTSSTPSTTSSPCSGPRGATRDARLTLVRAAQNTLKETLETLGIDALASM